MLKYFDPKVYPIALFVVIDDKPDMQKLSREFRHLEDGKPLDVDSEDILAFTCSVGRAKDGRKGVLIVIPYENATVGTVAHEALHVVQRMFELISEFSKGIEAEAYLLEWIVNCIALTKKEYKKSKKKKK